MSRCFPFPPPGYEKKIATDDPDLLKKEKHREKKHKKDKKDKEKKDRKVKKEKTKSEGKHREKKDKHRDKKKDKEKNDISTPDDKNIYGQSKGYIGERLHLNNEHNNFTDGKKPSIQFPHQNGDSLRNNNVNKVVQELDRRIRDDEKGTRSHQFAVESRKNNVEMQKIDGRQVVGFGGNVAVQNRINGATPLPLDSRRIEKMQETGSDDKQKRRKDKEMKLKERSEQKKAERGKNKNIMKSDLVAVANNISSTYPLENGFLGVGYEGNSKKRKDMETNGGSHENELRPNKLARPASNISPENGRKLDFSRSPGPNLYDKQGAPHGASQNSLKVSSQSGQRVNDMITSQPVSIPAKKPPISAINNLPSKPIKSPPVITNPLAARSPPVPTPKPPKPPPMPIPKKKPPHPDTKYLNQILSVPKPDQWCSYDNQEWLFTSKAGPTSWNPPTNDLEVQVWSEAKHIKSVDVCALPYVIPY